jgi:hypothetical protein
MIGGGLGVFDLCLCLSSALGYLRVCASTAPDIVKGERQAGGGDERRENEEKARN